MIKTMSKCSSMIKSAMTSALPFEHNDCALKTHSFSGDEGSTDGTEGDGDTSGAEEEGSSDRTEDEGSNDGTEDEGGTCRAEDEGGTSGTEGKGCASRTEDRGGTSETEGEGEDGRGEDEVCSSEVEDRGSGGDREDGLWRRGGPAGGRLCHRRWRRPPRRDRAVRGLGHSPSVLIRW